MADELARSFLAHSTASNTVHTRVAKINALINDPERSTLRLNRSDGCKNTRSA
jgi:hypothetical protein